MRLPAGLRTNPLSGALAVAAIAAAAHALTLSRYGFYRDELYFFACAKQPAWGFADQPPLLPALAAAAHGSIFALRMPCMVAAVATILVAALIARELGARLGGCTLCAAAVALMPGSLFLGNTATTTSFEPLTWTLTIYCTLRFRSRPGAVWWMALAATLTFAAYGKYSIVLLAAALGAAYAIARERRAALAVWSAAAAAMVALLPNIVWQAVHGFPMIAVLAGDVSGRHAFNAGPQYEFSGALANAPAFLAEQLAFPGLLTAPLWIAGLRRERIFGLTYALLVLAALALSAKGYYLIGIYPSLIAAGCAQFERYAKRMQIALAMAAVAGGLAFLPFGLPVLPRPPVLQPLFADEFGWDALTAAVAKRYDALDPPVRARTALFADTYGTAAALEYYGARHGLPQPISAQNQYYLWGRRGHDLSSVLAVGASQYWTLKHLYRNVRMLGTFSDPRRWVVEGPTPVYLCTGPRESPARIWETLRWYGA